MRHRTVWIAALILLVTMGIRQSMGLFVGPMREATALSIGEISFALAISQLVWGISQPLWGIAAEKIGDVRVIGLGGLLIALGLVMVSLKPSAFMLTFAVGLLMAAGAGAGSFALLIGSVSRQLDARARAMAAGLINAGVSLGQCLIAPFTQLLIATAGWIKSLEGLALLALFTLPLAWCIRAPTGSKTLTSSEDTGLSLGAQLGLAARDRSYWCLHLGFFTCGFHVAFLVTHLPSEVSLCGLNAAVAANTLAIIGFANVGGSLLAGALGNHVRMKWILAAMYASRTLFIVLYLASPKNASTFYLFGAVMGATWLATVPPTAGLTAKLFGTRHLSTLFGLTLISHQIGAFFGAWLGGLALLHTGTLQSLWWLDAGLALLAAGINLPIREAPIVRTAT